MLLSPPLCAQKAVGGVVENVLSVMLSLLPVAKHLGLTTTGVKWGLDAMPRVSVAGVLQAGTRVVDALLAGLKRGVAVPCPPAPPPVEAAVPAPAPVPVGGVLASDPPASTSGSSAVVSSAVASPGVQFCHSCHSSLPFVVFQHDGKVRFESGVWLCCELVVWHSCAWASCVHHMTARAPHVMTPSRWALVWLHAPGTSWRTGAAVHGSRLMLVCAIMTLACDVGLSVLVTQACCAQCAPLGSSMASIVSETELGLVRQATKAVEHAALRGNVEFTGVAHSTVCGGC